MLDWKQSDLASIIFIIGSLCLDETLSEGDYRPLEDGEIEKLFEPYKAYSDAFLKK